MAAGERAVNPYQYAVLRCVPRVEREEFLNVGAVVYCQRADFLDVAWDVSRERLASFAPSLDVDTVCAGLEFVAGVCRGDAALGGVAADDLGTRFGFLKAPRSTVLQPGPVHGGLTADPATTLADLLDRLVRLPHGMQE